MPVLETDLNHEIIVIGAGAAGLMAATELVDKGYKVTILEGAEHSGGRVRTILRSSFIQPVEEGAEFIHGKLPLTFQLLKEAGLPAQRAEGAGTSVIRGKWLTDDGMSGVWKQMIKQLEDLKDDISVDGFLEKYFRGPEFAGLRQSLRGFSEGYDAADTSRASALALSQELTPGIQGQFRIQGGYQQLIQFLESKCMAMGCHLFTSCIVKKIFWKKNAVKITSADGRTFTGQKVIITIPLGVLQAKTEIASINVEPDIKKYRHAASQMGYGSIVKILLQFKNPFWEKKKSGIGFIFSGEIIPTWWTQFPDRYPLLTGWVGGPGALAMKESTDIDILEAALQSLNTIFNLERVELRQMLTAWRIGNWQRDPFALGAYSYRTVESSRAIALMNIPVEETLFFAGEAYQDGPLTGTVEAALTSGKLAAKKIIR